jgi:hypothetical protein
MSTPVHDMMRVQIFGPVITVQPFADEAEAIAMANGVEFGLASSVWTADHGRALRCARAFDFGCVRRYGQSPPIASFAVPSSARAPPPQGMCLLRARRAAPRGCWVTARPATALGARASRRQSRRFHHRVDRLGVDQCAHPFRLGDAARWPQATLTGRP